ncbi:MAG: hypothetical protein ACYS5W_23025 [Planctomycetota bacterium]
MTSHAKLTRTSRLTVRALPPKADFNGKRAYRYAPKTGVIPTSGFTPSPSNVPVYRYK